MAEPFNASKLRVEQSACTDKYRFRRMSISEGPAGAFTTNLCDLAEAFASARKVRCDMKCSECLLAGNVWSYLMESGIEPRNWRSAPIEPMNRIIQDVLDEAKIFEPLASAQSCKSKVT